MKPKKKIQKLLHKYKRVLEEKMPVRDFVGLWGTYNNPNIRLSPGRMNNDMKTIEMYING